MKVVPFIRPPSVYLRLLLSASHLSFSESLLSEICSTLLCLRLCISYAWCAHLHCSKRQTNFHRITIHNQHS